MNRMWPLMVLYLCLSVAPASALPAHKVDGNLDDWGLNPQTVVTGNFFTKGEVFDELTLVPSTDDIDFTVEDSQPSAWDLSEYYDYEALYFDDTADLFYVAVIASHPWDKDSSTIRVTANDVTVSVPDADEFAWDNLHTDEVKRWFFFLPVDVPFPNYVYEAAWSTTRFGNPENGSLVNVYANCFCSASCRTPDSISLDAYTDQAVTPEPSTVALVAVALVGLGVVYRIRNRK